MAANSKIEWTTHTFNPWMGCVKVSPACKNCYAEREFDHHYKKVAWGPNGTRVLTSNENWGKPLKWNREAESSGVRARVFCASLADVFEDWQGPILNSKGERGIVPCTFGDWFFTNGPHSNCRDLTMNDVRQRLFALIDRTPNLDWLLLTKRPENISGMLFDPDSLNGHKYRENCWLGVSVENQEYADKRIPELLKCRDLSPVLFLSCEPLLGPVQLCDLERQSEDGQAFDWLSSAGIDWVIAGGESGPEARPTDPEWFRSLRDQCKASGVPFLFKQWGEWAPYSRGKDDIAALAVPNSLDEPLQRVGKKRAGRMLDGVLHDEFPKVRK
jgi:protein gp37